MMKDFLLSIPLSILLLASSPAAIAAPVASNMHTHQHEHQHHTKGSESETIQPYHAQYALRWNKHKLKIKAKRSLSINKGIGKLKIVASNFLAKTSQQADFNISQCEISPKSYQYKRSVLGKKKRYRAEFNQSSGFINETLNKKDSSVPYTPPVYDELSYQLALRCDLKSKINKGPFEYVVRTKARTKTYQFKIVGEEILSTPIGELKTIKLARVRSDRDNEGNHLTHIWFAIELDYVLVKLEQHDDDDFISMNIRKLKF